MAFGDFVFVPPRRGRGRALVAAAIVSSAAVLILLGAVALMRGVPGVPGAGGLAGACGGFQVIGAPAVTTLIDPATGARTEVLKISVTPNCAGTFIQGTFGSAFLRQATGFDFDSGFTLTAAASLEKLVYLVVNDRIIVEKLEISGNVGVCDIAAGGSLTWVPYNPAAKGAKGHLAAIPRVEWHTDLEIMLDDGQTIAKRVSSAQTTTDWQRDNVTIAEATWVGNLVTGDAPPDATGVVAVFLESDKRWNLATLSEWSAYVETTNIFCGPATYLWGRYGYPDNGRVGRQNAAVDALFSSVAALPVPGAFTADGSGYEVRAASQVQRPVIDLLIRGSFLGIVRPSGIPTLQFGGTDPAAYNAGNPGFLLFTAGNAGNFSAGMDLAVTCNGAPVGAAQRMTIDPGAPVPVRFPFTLAAQGTYNCEGRLTDLTSGAGAATAKSVFVLAVQLCQPGQVRGLGVTPGMFVSVPGGQDFMTPAGVADVQQCKADGSGWESILDCSALTATVTQSCKSISLGCISVGGIDCPAGTSVQGLDPTQVELQTGFSTCKTTMSYSTSATYSGGQWSCAGNTNWKSVTATIVPGATPPPVPVVSGTPAPVAAPPPAGAPAPSMPGGAPPPTPGFEAVFAIAGLLAVAYIINRRKR